MTASESNPFGQIKTYEQQAFARLTAYLEALDPDGWVEQSYCTDWLVYQVVSHIGSGSRIGGLRVRAWVGSGEPVSRDVMQQTWGYFDALQPHEMLAAYRDAAQEYLSVMASTPDDAGTREVEGFAGKRPLWAYQLARTWELGCHSWDVYVTRDRGARLDPLAVALLAPNLHYMNLPLDRERGSALKTNPVGFRLRDSANGYTLDPTAERPRLQKAGADAPLIISGPDEEIIRFVSGRHFLPGSRPELSVVEGSDQDLSQLRRAFR